MMAERPSLGAGAARCASGRRGGRAAVGVEIPANASGWSPYPEIMPSAAGSAAADGMIKSG